jgi:hypothetical protein
MYQFFKALMEGQNYYSAIRRFNISKQYCKQIAKLHPLYNGICEALNKYDRITLIKVEQHILHSKIKNNRIGLELSLIKTHNTTKIYYDNLHNGINIKADNNNNNKKRDINKLAFENAKHFIVKQIFL